MQEFRLQVFEPLGTFERPIGGCHTATGHSGHEINFVD